MMKCVRQMATIALLLMLGACATSNYGREFDETKAAQIKIGVTTRDQVQALYGTPTNRNKVDAHETWAYNQGSVSTGTAGGMAKSAAGTAATLVFGTLIPGTGPFISLGTTLAGAGSTSGMGDVAISSKMLVIEFNKEVVTNCTLTIVKGAHASEGGPTSDTETTRCGG